MPAQDNTILFITVIMTIISMIMVFVSLNYGWFGSCVEEADMFCESMNPGMIKQPSNTWSNLGFIVVGLVVAWSLSSRWYHHNRNILTNNKFYSVLLPCVIVLLGAGSMTLHATGSYSSSIVERYVMYLLGSFIMAYATVRFLVVRTIHFIVIFIFVFNTCVWAEAQANVHFIFYCFGNTIFVLYILISIIFELLNIVVRKQHCTNIWAYAMFGSLIIAFFIWKMSLTSNSWCNPDSIIQGHAIQHLINAFALYCLFRFYASEDCEPKFKVSVNNV